MTGGLPARGDAEPTPGIRQRCERKDAKGGGANAGCRVHQAGKVRTQGKKSAEGRIHFLEQASKDEKQEVKLVEIREGRRKEIKRRKAESWCRGEITKSSKETKGRKRGRQKAAEEQDGQRKRGKKKFGKDKGSNN